MECAKVIYWKQYTKKSIIFEKESFINAKKVLNFVQSLINEMKVIKPASKRRSIILRHTIKPGTPEHGTTEHGTPVEHRNTGRIPEHGRNNRILAEQSEYHGIV